MVVDPGVQRFQCGENLRIDAALLAPCRASAQGRGGRKNSECPGTCFPLHGRTHNEGADTYRQLTEAGTGGFVGVSDVHRAGQAHAAADRRTPADPDPDADRRASWDSSANLVA